MLDSAERRPNYRGVDWEIYKPIVGSWCFKGLSFVFFFAVDHSSFLKENYEAQLRFQ
jgi:hypothetical protein